MAPPPLRLLAALALVGASCGEVVEPEPFSMTTVEVTVVDSGASSVTAPLLGEQGSTTVAAANFFPVRDEDYVPDVLISTSRSVLLAEEFTVRPLEGSFAGLLTISAFDDLLGGLVVQRGSGGGDVLWLPAQGEEPTVLDESGGRLLDVGYVQGSPVAVVAFEDRLEQIRLVDTERFPLLELAEDEQVLALSASGDLHAMAVSNERCGEVQFFDTTGALLDLNGPGEPDCPVPRRAAYGAVALSPDGSSVAYTVVTYRNDGTEARTELVVRQLSSGAIFFRTRIGEDGQRIGAISFDGDRVVYLQEADGVSSVQVQKVRGEERGLSDIDVSGVGPIDSVSFARLPLADG